MIWSLTVWEPFTYSPEEGTKAAAMPDQIDEDIKADWQADVMELEEEVSF